MLCSKNEHTHTHTPPSYWHFLLPKSHYFCANAIRGQWLPQAWQRWQRGCCYLRSHNNKAPPPIPPYRPLGKISGGFLAPAPTLTLVNPLPHLTKRLHSCNEIPNIRLGLDGSRCFHSLTDKNLVRKRPQLRSSAAPALWLHGWSFRFDSCQTWLMKKKTMVISR